jgi:acetylornithine deacetylase/succinyl-diaminopimelate desuccinylase-like protein
VQAERCMGESLSLEPCTVDLVPPAPCIRGLAGDMAFVSVLKAPMIICGPGQAGLAHQPNEYVEISRLVESARILTLAAARLLTCA